MEMIDKAVKAGRTSLSEYESKQVLASYGIPVTREILVQRSEALLKAVHEIGYPLVVKGCSPEATHKTERGLIRTDVRNDQEALDAYKAISAAMTGSDAAVLVQEMVDGKRELVIGMTREPQFGPCVMFGLGGIFTEILDDVAFRVAPLQKRDAFAMMSEIKGRKILEAIRGMKAANLERLAEILIRVGQIGLDHERVKEIDINPVILSGSEPIAVDALVVLG
jgi:succinyl-CoA synthetase beta subunit